MSRGYLQNENHSEVLNLFSDMLRQNVKPNCYTLPPVLKACCEFFGFGEGIEIHCVAVKFGFISNGYVGTNLIEFYSGRGRVECAYKVFIEMVVKNVVSWTAMMNAYIGNGDLVSARKVFDLAPERDVVLWNRMIAGYVGDRDMVEARKLLDAMPGKDLLTWNIFLNEYAKSEDIEGCRNLFDAMGERDVYSWNGLIGGYVHNGNFLEVIKTFKRMLEEADVQPNDATLVNVVTACTRLGALDFGEWVHMFAEKRGYGRNLYVCNSLVDMYAKCGVVERAISVFKCMEGKDVVSWNTIINALAVHGHSSNALALFNEMKGVQGVKPDCITFMGILSACTHMGLVKDGLDHFRSMSREYSIEPEIRHYGCVVDLLGRSGLLDQAMEFINNMPLKPDNVIWTTFLAASRVHKRIEYAEVALRKLIELDPGNPAYYALLSNVYGEARKWDDLARLKVAVRDTGTRKVPGWSSIEIGDGLEEFYSFDGRHSKTKEIYEALGGLTLLLRLSELDFLEVG